MVGTAAALSLRMTVPGGDAMVAGVTAVATAPSYRRRGILTSLMHRQLADLRERGEAVAALFASEAGIYARFGYGAATSDLNLAIRRGEGALLAGATAPGAQGPQRLRTAEPRDATAELAKVFESVRHERPGMFARDDRWWEHILWDPEHRRSGRSPQRCVIAEDDAGPRRSWAGGIHAPLTWSSRSPTTSSPRTPGAGGCVRRAGPKTAERPASGHRPPPT
jgi:hypothetical protein